MSSTFLLLKLLSSVSGFRENKKAIKAELDKGANPNVVNQGYGVSAMHLASGQGEEATHFMLLYGGDPNVLSLWCETPLHVAASWGDLDTLHLLLRNGADINIQDQDGKTAFDWAIDGHNLECARLLKNLAVQQAKNDCTPHRPTGRDRNTELNVQSYRPRSTSAHKANKHLTTHVDTSASDFFTPTKTYSDIISESIYKYVEAGKPVCLNVTSPDTPVLGIKPSETNADSCCCAYYDDLLQNTCQERVCVIHQTGKPNCYFSPESLEFFHRDQPRACANIMYDNSSNSNCVSSMHLLEPALRDTQISRYHHIDQICGIDNSDNPSCAGMSSHTCTNSHILNHTTKPEIFCSGYRTSLDSGCYTQNGYNTRTSSLCPSSHCATSSCGLKSSLSPCKGLPSTSSVNGHNDLTRHSTRAKFQCYCASVRGTSPRVQSWKSAHRGGVTPEGQHRACEDILNCEKTTFCHSKTRSKAHTTKESASPTTKFNYEFKRQNIHKKETSLSHSLKSASSPNHPLGIKASHGSGYFNTTTSAPQETSKKVTLNKHAPPSPNQVSGIALTNGKLFPPLKNSCSESSWMDRYKTSIQEEVKDEFTAGIKHNTKKPRRRSLLKPSEAAPLLPKSQMNPSERVAKFILSVHDFMSECSLEDCSNDSSPDEHSPLVSSFEESTNSSKWKSPTPVIPDDDIITSDDSYVHKTCPRVYQMKCKSQLAQPSKKSQLRDKQNQPISAVDPNPLSSQGTVKLNSLVEVLPVTKKRLSSDSLFSTISVKEYVYRDKESNITFIERHIPSDNGSSIRQRSMDSTTSKATIDSQATLIYDWHALNEVLKSENLPLQDPFLSVTKDGSRKQKVTSGCKEVTCPQKHITKIYNKTDESTASGNTLHSLETVNSDNEDDKNAENVIIPDHLERMTCQEISQELQKYGEIPGPVIPATRQAYLRRLTTLESRPGLITLSKACPDYPLEMRQALNGQFDESGIIEMETKMVEDFNLSKKNYHCREGTAKSSFTYLLLDPRVTNNLPLRAKNMSDLEVFKTFICSVFYIGKGKRSRPYSHLYEAVSKVNKVNAKMNTKVKQIIDIWNAGLGVVSLHCFQSVIPVEAYTREACMILAFGLHKLTNLKHGDIYGAASSWTMTQRRRLGVFLLKKALQIFLAEGERQICLPDLKS